MILFFDCETTGLPLNWKAPMKDLNNWPRVIQLAWMLTDINGIELDQGKYLIKPMGWEMPLQQFWIDNGFSQERSLNHGYPIADVLDLFIKDIDDSKYLVSHNMSFDYNVVGAEMLRLQKKATGRPLKICTKEAGVDICKIKFPNGKDNNQFKWPKLEELHQFLFKTGFDGAHDAMADVVALKNCFFEMVRRNFITINK